MAKLLHIFYHKEGTFSLLCQQVQLFTHSCYTFIQAIMKQKIKRNQTFRTTTSSVL